MSNIVTASIVVQFSSSGGGMLVAEVDERPNGYNKGRTQFQPGDAPVILVYKTRDVVIDEMVVSLPAASLSQVGAGQADVVDDVQFANEAEGALSKPYQSGLSVQWLGRSLGTPQVIQETKLVVPNPGVAIARARYKSPFTAYRLNNVPSSLLGSTDFPVLIYISGHTE